MALPFELPFFGAYLNMLPVVMTLLTILSAVVQQEKELTPQLMKSQRLKLYLMAAAFFILFFALCLTDAGYGIIVVTNQAGSAKGLYKREDMNRLHHRFQEKCDGLILHFYYSPWHPSVTESLTRKPGTLMIEKAMAKFSIDPSVSWMVGDRDRDLLPAKKLGFNTIQVKRDDSRTADAYASDLPAAVEVILGK